MIDGSWIHCAKNLMKGGVSKSYVSSINLIEKIYAKQIDFNPELILKDVYGLDHPNVEKIKGVSEINGENYLIKEYIFGEDLSRFIGYTHEFEIQPYQESPQMDIVFKIALGICEGLMNIHQNNLYHGNICTNNVIITPSNFPIITNICPNQDHNEINRNQYQKNDIICLGKLLSEVFGYKPTAKIQQNALWKVANKNLLTIYEIVKFKENAKYSQEFEIDRMIQEINSFFDICTGKDEILGNQFERTVTAVCPIHLNNKKQKVNQKDIFKAIETSDTQIVINLLYQGICVDITNHEFPFCFLEKLPFMLQPFWKTMPL